MEEVMSNPLAREFLLVLLGSVTLATLFHDAVAQLAARVPVIGGLLAVIVRRITPAAWDWLHNRVKEAAERAVRQADAIAPDADGRTRAMLARNALMKEQPGLTQSEAEREIEAAFQRVMADHKRAAEETAAVAAKAAREAVRSVTFDAAKTAGKNGAQELAR